VLPFKAEAGGEAGRIRAYLAAAGKMIGAYDLLIAGHARALEAILVTTNVKEFSRVARLSIENWATTKS
jgi:tRNA(fMet)-specific endonuclease VapC